MDEDFQHYYPKSDRGSFHDTLHDLFGETFDEEQQEKYFMELPESAKFTAYEWGLSDTCFRDEAWTFLKEKYNL
jgi:hypothetical protein